MSGWKEYKAHNMMEVDNNSMPWPYTPDGHHLNWISAQPAAVVANNLTWVLDANRLTATPAFNLTRIEQGTSTNQRVGHVIALKELRIKGSFLQMDNINDQKVPLQTGYYRMIAVYDMQPNHAFPGPVITDILLEQGFNLNNPPGPFTDYNFNNRERYLILYDETFPMNMETPAGVFANGISIGIDSKTLQVNVRVNLMNLTTLWQASVTTATTPQNGAVWVYLLHYPGNLVPIPANPVLFTGNFTLFFSD